MFLHALNINRSKIYMSVQMAATLSDSVTVKPDWKRQTHGRKQLL